MSQANPQALNVYNVLIKKIMPLLMYVAPEKQRAVLEVLSRKTQGITIAFPDKNKENPDYYNIKVSFHFDVGDGVDMNFIVDFTVFSHVDSLLCNEFLYNVLTLNRKKELVRIIEALASVEDVSDDVVGMAFYTDDPEYGGVMEIIRCDEFEDDKVITTRHVVVGIEQDDETQPV